MIKNLKFAIWVSLGQKSLLYVRRPHGPNGVSLKSLPLQFCSVSYNLIILLLHDGFEGSVFQICK